MISEITLPLSEDERNTLLFLTNGQRIIDLRDLDENSKWNTKEFFGYNRNTTSKLLKVIIKKQEVILKLWT